MCGRVKSAEFWKQDQGYKRMVLQVFPGPHEDRVKRKSEVYSLGFLPNAPWYQDFGARSLQGGAPWKHSEGVAQ